MSLDAQRVTILTALKNGLAVNYPALAVDYPNEEFTQPNNEPWVEASIESGDSTQANLGLVNIVERFPGFLQCSVAVSRDSGTKTQNEIAEEIGRIFSRKQFSSGTGCITFKTPDYSGPTELNEQSILVVRINFTRDTRY